MRLRIRPIYLLLVFVPASFLLELGHSSPTWVFICSCAAVLPLAGLLGEATEQLTAKMGATVGGLLNATFGNAAELIIGYMALRAGEVDIVKASLTGSIIGNLLVVLGLAIVFGGWTHKQLRFNRLAAETATGSLMLAVTSLVIPAIYAASTRHRQPESTENISLVISGILIGTYAASLLFSLKTHSRLFPAPTEHPPAAHVPAAPGWSTTRSLLTLGIAALFIGFVSEFLVGAVGAAGEALGLGNIFMGVIVIALIGNAAEHSTAVLAALDGDMDLSLGIALGSSTQVALFVAPLLVIAGHAMATPMGLEFTMLEVAAVMFSVLAVSALIRDGETNWLEGIQLIATYAIMAIAFYFL
jgi:Ca2+:H+ antiporter